MIRILAVLIAAAGLASRPAQVASEYEVKAAFLYNFAQYVEWPASAYADRETPFTVGILGDDPFGETIDRALKDKKVDGRPVRVRRSSDAAELKTCLIVFVSKAEQARWKSHLESLKPSPVLTVSESAGFASAGGMVNFYLEGSKVRFEINPDAATRAGLKVGSKLLKLARIVKEN